MKNLNSFLFYCLAIGAIFLPYYCYYLYHRWNLYQRNIKDMSEKTLMKIEDAWLQPYAFQGHSEMFHVKRAWAKQDSDDSKITAAYKRVLEIQEELLVRQKHSNESWGGNYIDRLKGRILSTRQMLELCERHAKPRTSPSIPNKQTTTPIADLNKSAKQPINFDQANQSATIYKKTITQQKPTPKKSNKSLFIESFGNYLWNVGTSPGAHSAIMRYLRHPKEISFLSEDKKQNIVGRIYKYREQASQEELEKIDGIMTKLINLLEEPSD